MSKNKAIKITGMTLGLMIGTMIAGAGLATAGWWYSDRLILGFGSPVDIDAVGQSKGDCDPETTATNKVLGKDGNTYKQELKCVNDNSYITKLKYVKTRQGEMLVPITNISTTIGGNDKAQVVKALATGPRWVPTSGMVKDTSVQNIYQKNLQKKTGAGR